MGPSSTHDKAFEFSDRKQSLLPRHEFPSCSKNINNFLKANSRLPESLQEESKVCDQVECCHVEVALTDRKRNVTVRFRSNSCTAQDTLSKGFPSGVTTFIC